MIDIKEAELYQELELFADGVKIGEAEISIKAKMLSRFEIFEPYRDKGYGTAVIEALKEKYQINSLWVRSNNDRAIHVYQKCGFVRDKETMFSMRLESEEPDEQQTEAKI